MYSLLDEHTLVCLVGLSGGLLLGLAARLGRFCTLGAIEDALYSGSDLRLRMWGIAVGVAVVGTYGASAFGLVDPASAGVLSAGWNPLGSIIGGLVFGYGMALAGNCGYGALARLGGGDLRSFVIVLVMGLSAYVVLSGPLAFVRVWLFGSEAWDATVPALPALAEAATGLRADLFGILAGLAILIAVSLPAHVRSSGQTLLWGSVVGLAIVSGWVGTSLIGTFGFEEITTRSHTFSAPVGETMLFAMTASGNTLSFGIGSVAGVWIGAFLGSLIKGQFRWEACEDPRELKRQIFGAGMMGAGAVVAVGCSVGQGLSAMSLLALSAPVTLAAIFAGAAFGLRQLIEGFQPAE